MGLLVSLDQFLVDFLRFHDLPALVSLGLLIFAASAWPGTSFLPGNSLLFAAGAFAARGLLPAGPLFFLFSAAAILGGALGYGLGASAGRGIFDRPAGRLFPPKSLAASRALFEARGDKALLWARFRAKTRGLVPFIAGAGEMSYRSFLRWNLLGGLLWPGFWLLAGKGFMALPPIQERPALLLPAAVLIAVAGKKRG